MKVKKQQVKQKRTQKMKLGNNKEQVVEPEPVVEPKVETPATQIEVKEENPIEIETIHTEEKKETNKSLSCLKGGTEHIDGSGPYEHGYYTTYDEAKQACKDYLATMTTGGNYRVDRCICGKVYYFYCKPF